MRLRESEREREKGSRVGGVGVTVLIGYWQGGAGREKKGAGRDIKTRGEKKMVWSEKERKMIMRKEE